MYNMDLQKVLQARLFVNGNYVALLILGAGGRLELSDEEQARFAAGEAAKVDAAWSGIFGSAENVIVIPEDDGSDNGGFFDMTVIALTPSCPTPAPIRRALRMRQKGIPPTGRTAAGRTTERRPRRKRSCPPARSLPA